MLEIYAGKKALATLRQEGFHSEIFANFFAASGGPKWFVLFGLDKYLFAEYFKDRKKPLNLLGSSSGAFRASCFGQKDPVTAISRFAKAYLETTYSKKPTPKEISNSGKAMIDAILLDGSIDEILQNPTMKVNFIATKVKGLLSTNIKLAQIIGLLGDYSLNRISRRLLRSRYERAIFQVPSSELVIEDKHHIDTHYIHLNAANFKRSLLASGSIPVIMECVKNIPSAPAGYYIDGGMIDYHLDLGVKSNNGLTLYPHFSSTPKAGWLDKNLKRSVLKEHYENVVMLAPTAQFIQSLPYQKIPDRLDFKHLADADRMKAWRRVLSESERLAESFNEIAHKNDFSKVMAF